jgi:hypothetical protein
MHIMQEQTEGVARARGRSNDEVSALCEALGQTIATLHAIKERAANGSQSTISDWYCEQIEAIAESALTAIVDAMKRASHH